MDAGFGAELGRLIADASAALMQLDAEALEELERRGAMLAAQLSGMAPATAAMLKAGLESRRRVFAGMVQATGENLAVLRRAEAREAAARTGFGAAAFGLGEAMAEPGARRV